MINRGLLVRLEAKQDIDLLNVVEKKFSQITEGGS